MEVLVDHEERHDGVDAGNRRDVLVVLQCGRCVVRRPVLTNVHSPSLKSFRLPCAWPRALVSYIERPGQVWPEELPRLSQFDKNVLYAQRRTSLGLLGRATTVGHAVTDLLTDACDSFCVPGLGPTLWPLAQREVRRGPGRGGDDRPRPACPLGAYVEPAGAKLVLTGDHFQLLAVGPGGRWLPSRSVTPTRSTTCGRTGANATRASAKRCKRCATGTSPRRFPGTWSSDACTLSPPGTKRCRSRSTPGQPTLPPGTRPGCTPGGGPTWPS
jgi:hypothetical protein